MLVAFSVEVWKLGDICTFGTSEELYFLANITLAFAKVEFSILLFHRTIAVYTANPNGLVLKVQQKRTK